MYYLEMKALLTGLDEAKGDVAGPDTALRASLSKLSLDSPQGPVKLDANRQAIGSNYLFKVTKGQSSLLKEVPNVTQTLGQPADQYTSQPAFDRTHPSCG
jgi:branched-chain amino acid transport system substrate-binding protein